MRRRAKSGLKKTKKHAIVFIEVMECHGQPIKKNALRLVTAGRSFAVGSAASTVCHMRCSPLPPQQSKDQRPQDTSQNTDQERYDKVIEHHETPSLPYRIGLVGPWQLQYITTDDKTPTAAGIAVGVFIWKFIPARNRRRVPCARSRPPRLRARQSVQHCGHRSSHRMRVPPPLSIPPAPCGR